MQQLEEQMQIMAKENQDLKIVNASLTTENDLLRKQVAYFQGVVAGSKLSMVGGTEDLPLPVQEEIPCGDPAPQVEDHVEDPDYAFIGGGRETMMSPSALFATVTIGLMCVVSFVFGGSSGTAGNGAVVTDHGLKSVNENEQGWMRTVWNWALNPYLLMMVYMAIMIFLVLRSEKSWTRSKFRKILAKLRSHSKTS